MHLSLSAGDPLHAASDHPERRAGLGVGHLRRPDDGVLQQRRQLQRQLLQPGAGDDCWRWVGFVLGPWVGKSGDSDLKAANAEKKK